MNKKILIKYENIYLLFSFIFTIFQIVAHINNNITFTNLIIELIIFTFLHLTIYDILKDLRIKKEL